MNRDDLDQAYTAAIRRHWRDLDDRGGQPGAALLDELAKVTGQADHSGCYMLPPGDEAAELRAELERTWAERDGLRELAAEILGSFSRGSDGHRARVGQVQYGKWRKAAGLEES